MKRGIFIMFSLITIALTSNALAVTSDTLMFGRFGKVYIYRQTPNPSQIVLFVSGDGGWNLGVVGMAKELAGTDALVVGIDIIHYLKQLEGADETCSYPASDFEALSQFIQKKYDFPTYITPILVGYSSGATLVYAILVQAPFNTFKGAISLGFCPDLEVTKPFCKGSGLEWKKNPKAKGVLFEPAKTLEVPWIALQGMIDQVCDPPSTIEYVKQVPNGEVVTLPKVGHGYSVERNWMPQFKEAFARVVSKYKPAAPAPAQTSDEIKDLPLTEVAAKDSTNNVMSFIVSGDGGWGTTERGISSTLAEHDIPTVGLNSLQYFWSKKTPDDAAASLTRILDHYLFAWNKSKVILTGYSLGAEVLPFMINRLPDSLKNKIELVALLGPTASADFEFHFVDWLGSFSHKNELPVKPELEKMKGMRILCFYGEDDKDAICPSLDSSLAIPIPTGGGHRLRGNYEPVTDAILQQIKQ
jgi:type IV secretory pathway VirJ component